MIQFRFATAVIALLLLPVALFAQAPFKFNYQGVARDASGNLLANQTIGLRVSIISGSPSGTNQLIETHVPTSNDFGLFNIEIGGGTNVLANPSFDLGADVHFLKVELDATGGTNYIEMGISQLLSVPYALHASVAESVTNDQINDADADPSNELQILSLSNDTVYLSGSGGFIVLPGTQGNLPQVTTDTTVVENQTFGRAYGSVVATGGELILYRGIAYGPSPNPTVDDDYVFLGPSQPGEFDLYLPDMEPGSDQYVRAFATNAHGTAYGSNRIMNVPYGDFDGQYLCFVTACSGPIGYFIQIDVDYGLLPIVTVWNFGNSGQTVQMGGTINGNLIDVGPATEGLSSYVGFGTLSNGVISWTYDITTDGDTENCTCECHKQ